MKVPVPATLFSRLILILVVGLIAAQLLAGIVLYQERIRTLYHASGLQSAQRISEIVHLLESHTSDEREHLIRVLNTSRLRIGLDGAAWDEAASGAGNKALVSLFSTILRRNLGDGRPVQVTVTPAKGLTEVFPKLQRQGAGRGQGLGMGRRHRMAKMGLAPGSGLYFLVRVQLPDGAWVTFDHRVPEQSADWPWRLSFTMAILLIAVVALSTLAVRWLTRPLSTLAGAAEQLGRDINSLLSLRLIHRRFPKIFRSGSGPSSHINRTGGIALEDGRIRKNGEPMPGGRWFARRGSREVGDRRSGGGVAAGHGPPH